VGPNDETLAVMPTISSRTATENYIIQMATFSIAKHKIYSTVIANSLGLIHEREEMYFSILSRD